MSDELKAAEPAEPGWYQFQAKADKSVLLCGYWTGTGPYLFVGVDSPTADTWFPVGDGCDFVRLVPLAEHPADDDEPVTVEWLRSVGFRSWDGDEDEFELYLRIRDEICWECRLAYQANGIYAVRMCDPEDVGRVLASESVELLGTRNKTPALTRGDVRRLCAALGITLTESEVVR